MTEHTDIATVVVLSGLGILALLGLAVVLLILVHSRRIRHRADLSELRLQHANAVREVEREVEAHTLKELGRELHDGVGQLLTSVRMDINAVILASDGSPVAQGMKETLDHAIAELRRLSHTLIADRLRRKPISEALQEECLRLHRPGTLEISFRSDGLEPTLPPDHKVVLYRIFQEGLNNALKHARADRIQVALSSGEGVRMTIQDNGVGFDPEVERHKGAGLNNIQHRAGLIGLRCWLSSSPGAGTTIRIST